tara:strand:- start:2549 stop:3145 length:597 start_codon:yes stop_codon:yes gene_type:complete
MANRRRNKQSHAEKTISALSTVRSGNNLNASLLNRQGYTPLPSSQFSDLFRTTGTHTPSNRDVLFEPSMNEPQFSAGEKPVAPREPRVADYNGKQLRGQPPVFKSKSDEIAYNSAVSTFKAEADKYPSSVKAWEAESESKARALKLSSAKYKTDLSKRGRNTTARSLRGTTTVRGRSADASKSKKAKFGGAVGRNGVL